MKITIIQTQAQGGGAQRAASTIAEGLRTRGHDVEQVFFYRLTGAYADDPQTICLLERKPEGIKDYGRIFLSLFRHLRKSRPDAVVCFQHYGNVIGAPIARAAGCKIVVANQNGAPGGVGLPRVAYWLDAILGSTGMYSANIAQTEFTARCFEGYPRTYRKRLQIVRRGIRAFGSTLSKADARRRFGLDVAGRLIATTGRLAAQKNHASLIRALSGVPDAALAIAGDGPDLADLRALTRELGVERRVFFLGELPPQDIADFLAAADVFAFASVWETFGNSVVEAASAGLPIACSNLTVLTEVMEVEGEPCAVFFDQNDPEDIATAIRSLLDRKELSMRLSEAGRAITQKYSFERMIDGYENLLKKLAHGDATR